MASRAIDALSVFIVDGKVLGNGVGLAVTYHHANYVARVVWSRDPGADIGIHTLGFHADRTAGAIIKGDTIRRQFTL